MQTEFPERYITLGLKIAYYRKKAGFTQEVLAEKIGKVSTSLARWKGLVRFAAYPLKHYSKLPKF